MRFFGHVLTIDYRLGSVSCPKLGLTVPRKVGKAVFRNRFKRLVREAFRHNCSLLPPNLELIVFPCKGLETFSLKEVEEDLITLNQRLASGVSTQSTTTASR